MADTVITCSEFLQWHGPVGDWYSLKRSCALPGELTPGRGSLGSARLHRLPGGCGSDVFLPAAWPAALAAVAPASGFRGCSHNLPHLRHSNRQRL